MSRKAFREADFKKSEEDYDTVLNQSIARLKAGRGRPEDWEQVCHYVRSLALPIEQNAELTETVKAVYHQKCLAAKIAYRLQGLD